ncbi:MAG: bifunctional ADP-heptose synthase [Bacteroidia bacterium]|nr:bifunctional ADP-heptose synthase [Bacteroidia bacterium]MDW8057060.1 bifunctional ADP-heptose synthase [Bacteroidia bacterium]
MELSKLRFLVIGDVMLDRYLYGKVQRISPEAPVPIFELEKEENRLGGAANVALNLRSLDAQVAIAGLIGTDTPGTLLRQQSEEWGIETFGLVTDPERPTTVKTRLIAQKHHLLRVDREITTPPPPTTAEALTLKIHSLLHSPLQGIILEDYDKGTLTEPLIREIIRLAKERDIPVSVDPKKRNFWLYEGATIFKPNLRELSEALGTSLSEAPLEAIQEAILQLRQRMPHTYTVVTLSDRGILAYGEEEGFIHVPAHYRNIVDVSGAGDTVVSVLAVGLALKMPLRQIVALANLAGGLVCEYVGVVPIPKDRWLESARALGLL